MGKKATKTVTIHASMKRIHCSWGKRPEKQTKQSDSKAEVTTHADSGYHPGESGTQERQCFLDPEVQCLPQTKA